MKVTFVLAITSLLFFVLFSSCNAVYALEENVGFARISPSSPIYFLKTIREDLELKFAGTTRTKIIRQMEFATRRLRESKSLVGTKDEDLIQATLERYWYNLSHVLNFTPKDKELALLTNHVVGVHLKELENMYTQLKSDRAQLSIRSAVNRLMQNSEASGSTRFLGCNFLLKESSSSALTQAERVILKERGDSCFGKVKLII